LDETQEQDGAQSSEHDEENHHNETESEHVESDDHKSSSEDKNELGLLMSDVENVELQAHSENSSALAILKDIISNMNKEAMKNSQTVQPVEVDEETDTLNRTKRQVNDVSQHLDEDPDKIPSKDLPLEHRGLDDEEEFDDSVDHSHHHHPHHGRKSNGSATSQLSVVLTLFTALICFSRFRW